MVINSLLVASIRFKVNWVIMNKMNRICLIIFCIIKCPIYKWGMHRSIHSIWCPYVLDSQITCLAIIALLTCHLSIVYCLPLSWRVKTTITSCCLLLRSYCYSFFFFILWIFRFYFLFFLQNLTIHLWWRATTWTL